MKEIPTLIRGGTIVTADANRTILHDGGIVIRGNTIESILTAEEVRSLGTFEGELVDASSLVVLPGFIQTHIHLCQTLFRGLADDLPLLDWLRLRIFPLEAAHNSKSMRASALLGLAELIGSGTTTIMDMGTVHFQDEIVQSVEEAGIRAFVGKAMMDQNDHYGRLKESTHDSLNSSLRLAETYHGQADGRIRYAFAPRFVLSCTEKLLRETNEMLQNIKGTLLHTHAAENREEVSAVHTRCGMGNIEYFHHIGILHDRTCLAHCIWLNDREVQLMSEQQAKVLHCPSSNLKLGSGIANIPAYLSKGITVSLGADGAPCNNNLSIFAEMRLAALIQKPSHGAKAMDAKSVFELATIGGAKALTLENEIGSLEKGKKADLVFLDLGKLWNSPWQNTKDGIYSAIVYSCDPRNVHSVMVDGRWLLRERELLTLDENEVVHNSIVELTRLTRRIES